MPDDTRNSADHNAPIAAETIVPSRWPLLLGLGVGIIAALLSMSLQHSISRFFGDAGFVITAALFPGILASIAIAGNAHAFSLWVAGGFNFVFYFFFVWIICSVSGRILRNFS